MPKNVRIILLLALILQAACNSYNYTEEESSSTVKLRNELMNLARGEQKEIIGNTESDEGYVLLYGYMGENWHKHLPISADLITKLESIRPAKHYKGYVLAHFKGDNILEYTRWLYNGKPFDYRFLKAPFVIKGSPYSVKFGSDNLKLVN